MDAYIQKKNRITLSDPGELISAIPHILGFHPVDSVVVVSLEEKSGSILSLALRADLPSSAEYSDLMSHLIVRLSTSDSTSVVLVVVGGAAAEPSLVLPHRGLVSECNARFAAAHLPVLHRLWVSGTTAGSAWRCYDDIDCAGTVPDSDASPIALARVAAGSVLHERREDFAATLAPVDEDVLARRTALLASPCVHGGSVAGSRGRLQLVEVAIDHAMEGALPESDEDIVTLAAALVDHVVRDSCLSQVSADRRAGAERLWTYLARNTPAPARAESACLLAFSAYQRGDGVLAGIALEQALEADPSHRLSGLVDAALSIGLMPDRLREAGERAAGLARDQLAQAEDQ